MVRFLFFFAVLISFFTQAQTGSDSISLVTRNSAAFDVYLLSPDSAIKMAMTTMAYGIKNKNRFAQGQSYFVLSKANWAKGNYHLSIEYAYKGLQIFENTEHVLDWHQCLLSIARDYIDLNELRQARKTMMAAVTLARRAENERLLADTWREFSFLLLKEGKYDSAIVVADLGLAFADKTGIRKDVGILYSRKSATYLQKKDYAKSRVFNRMSFRTNQITKNNRLLSIDLYESGDSYVRRNLLDSAMHELRLSDSVANYIGNFSRRILCHEKMAVVLERQHKTEALIDELKNIGKMKDSLARGESKRLLAEASSVNELENKEKEILLLETENRVARQTVTIQRWVGGFLGGLIVLMVVIVVLLSRLRKQQAAANQLLADKNAAIELQREEIRAQAENLQQLNQLKVKLFSVISHDLRGPITNLQVLLDMLTRKMMTPDEFLTLSDKLKVDVSVNQRTLENLLAWSMSQMEGIKTEPRLIVINAAIDEVCRLMTEMATRKGIALKSDISGNFSVVADHDQVQLILRNIIHNAIKFSQNDSSVQIATHAAGASCRISIRDYGVGLTAREIEILSTANSYYTKAGTQKEKGTGLGWLLCKEFIKRNGGSFEITSAVGEGTTVSFTLPLG